MSQQEYIRRGAVCAALGCENATKYGNKTPEQRDRSYSTLMLYEIADAIDDVPAADVVPVVHGKWEYKPVFNFDGQGFPRYFCSACENYETQTRRFCPNCGAKMDLTKENHDI